jgi:hypothetical protein
MSPQVLLGFRPTSIELTMLAGLFTEGGKRQEGGPGAFTGIRLVKL